MKYIIVLGDGMADEPVESLGKKTPLQFASKPYLDYLTKNGNTGLLHTVPPGITPGSEVANLSVLGYAPEEVLEGRGALEAASAGVDVLPGELIMRCNFIYIQDGILKNHSAGHISNDESKILVDFLNEKLSNDILRFFPGISYRNLLKLKDGNKYIDCAPPHDFPETPIRELMIKAQNPEAQQTADYLNELILKSQELLENHPINTKREQAGKAKANSIWPWSPGYLPKMKKMTEIFPIKSGAVISAVDLIRGIGIYAGLDVIEVEGATGLYDTNYEGKAQAAIEALRNHDFVFLHIEASDEAGHEGNVDLKVKTIEYLDQKILKPIIEETKNWKEPVSIAVLPDHPTPCRTRKHTSDPVPFAIYSPGKEADQVEVYDEFSVRNGRFGLLKGSEFIKTFFNS